MADYVSSLTGEQIEAVLTGVRAVNGIIKSNGLGTFQVAVAGTDYSYPLLIGVGNPTGLTVGSVGQMFFNSTSNKLFMCKSVASSTYTWVEVSGGEATWGNITGTLSEQTDLNTVLTSQSSQIVSLQSSKVNEPSSEGTDGQVLATDGEGARYWKTVSGGSGTSDYNDLSNRPKINNVTLSGNKTTADLGIVIPTKTSDLTNDSGFLTEHQSLANYDTKNEVNTKISNATNGMATQTWVESKGYLTEHQSLSAYRTASAQDTIDNGKQATLVSGTNIKTINNQSLLGSGNIEISGSGAVNSVNGKTGTVVLDAEDVGALPDSTVIPSKTSELTNDSGFLTEHQSLVGYATQAWVNAQGFITSLAGYATEAWVNAQGFLKEHQSLSAYRTASAQDVIDENQSSQIVQLDSTVGGHTTSITNLQTDVATKITNPSGGEVGNVLKKTASGVEWGEGGGGSADTYLLVFCQVGDSVTVTDNGSYTETKTLSTGTSLRFDLPSLGIYYATCDSHSATVDATFYGKYELDFRAFTFGISRSTSSSSVAWTRTDDSVGFNVSASVGTTAGHSDFDDYPIYREIERVTLNTGDVMVKIPKFYCRRYVENGTEYIKISNRQQTGFIIHPAFQHNGNTQEYIYVGAYKTTSGHYSKTGLAPLVNLTRASFRSNAKAKGDGWSQMDITAISAVQMLMMVEFATNDMQSAIGEGWSASSHSGAINTGTCDAVPNLTGRPSGTSNNVDVVYRGIEGFWGNVWEWFDGLNWNGGAYWICNNQSNFADDTSTNYTQLGYNGGSTGWSSSYITAMGCDLNNQAIILPTTAGSGSATTYYADVVWSSTGWRVAIRGGSWNFGSMVGLFTLAVTLASSYASSDLGSRLLYIP